MIEGQKVMGSTNSLFCWSTKEAVLAQIFMRVGLYEPGNSV
jgi:hypothetical protein